MSCFYSNDTLDKGTFWNISVSWYSVFCLINISKSLLIQRNNHIVSGFIDSCAKTNVSELSPMSSRTRIDMT